MANVQSLMGLGLPAALAKAIGQGPPVSVVPAGSTQAGATAFSSSYVTLTTASAAGVMLPPASGAAMTIIYNNSGNTQTLYPNVNTADTVNATTSVNLTSAKVALAVPSKGAWLVLQGA